ncbi:MAG TPA: Ig-like domain-containing protein [Candidatus Limnocylindrales bacterium]|nr:Ig-like domain-containing protein [Candidatus Limnocylindrales bacterium]
MAVAGSVLALEALSAALAPPPAVALGLIANGDSATVVHDRTRSVSAPGVLANDVTLLGARATLSTPPVHGTVQLDADGGYRYTPDLHYVGGDSFWYRDSGLLQSNAAKVSITVTNEAPSAVRDDYSVKAGATLVVPAPGVLGNDGDADGDTLTADLVDDGGNGSLSVTPNGSVRFPVSASIAGRRTFTYRVSDGIDWSGTATVSIDVVASPTSTPSPSAVATPAPTTTPRPTGTTAPRPTSTPTPGSSAPPVGPAGSPASAQPSGSAAAPPTPEPTPGPAVGIPGPGFEGPPAGGGSGRSPGGQPFLVGEQGSGERLVLSTGLMGFGDGLAWAVPTLVLTVPGLLLVLAVLAQALGALAWKPAVRRWLGPASHVRRRPAEPGG